MNRSGEAVRRVVGYYLTPGDLFHMTPGVGERIFVVHDELDLPLGRLQIRRGIGAAGHKGIQSVIEALGTKDFVRFRVGIENLARRRSVPFLKDARKDSSTLLERNTKSSLGENLGKQLSSEDNKSTKFSTPFKRAHSHLHTLPSKTNANLKDACAEDYVLSNFTKNEMVVIKPAIKKTAKAVIYAIENGAEAAMNKYNR
jgi:peptidyl-tRNA hydrolase